MDALEELAFRIRYNAVKKEKMFSPEGLAMVVCPTPGVREASLRAARLLSAGRRNLLETRRPQKRKRQVSITELAAGY